jgi:hypothetical protein
MSIIKAGTPLMTGMAALALTACGGGGSSGEVASIPPPPSTVVTPTPLPSAAPVTSLGQIVASAVPDQPLAAMGGIVRPDSSDRDVASTAEADQIKLRYDSAAGQYQIQVPPGSSWEGLLYNSSTGAFITGTPSSPYIKFPESAATGYKYSALASLFLGPSPSGVFASGDAFGIPTPSGGVPTTGSASYSGTIAGFTTETASAWGAWGAAEVEGNIHLSFNFGGGTLAGTINPSIRFGPQSNALDPLNFTNTVFAPGSTTFSGSFATTLSGTNAFSGQFTGPQAQELIGSFAFPYTSHDDGKVYQATGGFVGKQ